VSLVLAAEHLVRGPAQKLKPFDCTSFLVSSP